MRKNILSIISKNSLLFVLVLLVSVLTTANAFAALTLNSNTISSNGALTLVGTANSTWDLGTGHDLFLQTSGGKVGIGTTNPGYALDVNGSINLGSVANAIRIAGDTVLRMPADSTFLGVGAGTGATDTYNTAIGTGALNAVGGHYGNVAVGWEALNVNTTGGNDNVAVGNLALGHNTTADHSTAVGTSALGTSTTGQGNAAFGWQTMNANTTGYHNAAAGALALPFNTTGAENSAFGESALYGNTTGSDNVGVGFQSGYGSGATPNTTGSNNTFIGVKSAPAANGLTNATAIGYQAIVGQSNAIVLGGTGGSAVNVGIGTTTPGATLDVQGSLNLEKGTGTVSTNAVTISKTSGVITDSTDINTDTTRAAITLTNTRITTTSVVTASICSTPDAGARLGVAVTPGSGSAVVSVYNSGTSNQTSDYKVCFIVTN